MKDDPNPSSQTHAEFLASLFEAYTKARPLAFFRQWRPEDLLDSGIPRDWLEQNHLVKADGGATEFPTFCSQRDFAEIVTKMFGTPVNQSVVSRAIRNEGMANCVTASNGRIRTDSGLQWWRQNKTASVEAVTSEAEFKRERQRIAKEREQIELDRIKKIESDTWLLKSEVGFTFDAYGNTVKTIVRNILEKQENRPDLFDQFQAELLSAGRAILKSAADNDKKLKAEL